MQYVVPVCTAPGMQCGVDTPQEVTGAEAVQIKGPGEALRLADPIQPGRRKGVDQRVL